MKTNRVLIILSALGFGVALLQGCAHATAEDDGQAEGAATEACVPGHLYCGGDKVKGDARSLYQCEGGDKGRLVARCATGCSVNAGRDDSCKPGGPCVDGRKYCGGDTINGHPDAVYECVQFTGLQEAVLLQQCGGGCGAHPGQDSSCNSAPSCNAGERHCGGDKVDGDPSYLYACKPDGSLEEAGKCKPGYVAYSSSCAETYCEPEEGHGEYQR